VGENKFEVSGVRKRKTGPDEAEGGRGKSGIRPDLAITIVQKPAGAWQGA
jgi:hypothetical protein